MHGKVTKRVHKHGRFLLLVLYRDTVYLSTWSVHPNLVCFSTSVPYITLSINNVIITQLV